jgi:hypothetical protein
MYPQIDLARCVRVAQHMAAKIRRVQPGRLGMLDKDAADEALNAPAATAA